MTIASAFGVSLATENTNVSQNIGSVFINISLAIGGKVRAVGARLCWSGSRGANP